MALIQGNVIYASPPSPHFCPEARGQFSGRGGGGCILKPPAAGILYVPLFDTPPTPRRVFLGGGGGCIKFGPVIELFQAIRSGIDLI